jgi:hypothetical protein
MLLNDDLMLLTPSDLVGASSDPTLAAAHEAQQVWQWASTFVSSPHADLGRRGAVCPYTRGSIDHEIFYLGLPDVSGLGPCDIVTLVRRYRDWYLELRDQVPEERRHLVSVIVVLGDCDRADPAPLEAIHADLKPEFVQLGLMLGEFHPHSDTPGVWSADFRPLRSPVPMLVMREMVASDLPFLTGHPDHIAAYFERFGQAIPPHTRRFLVDRLVDR